MIDLHLLRDQPELVARLVRKKDPSFNIAQLIDLDVRLREARTQLEQFRYTKNDLARQAKDGVSPELREQSISCGKEIKQREQEVTVLELEFRALYLHCPNIPEESIPEGNKESNLVVRTHGSKAQFKFQPKHHLELGNALGWFDFESATRMSSSNFALYKGDAVLLQYALAQFFLKNNIAHGYSPISPPYLVNEESLEIASNFPKFKDQVYAIPGDNLYLTPTAEVNLTNYYREKIFTADELPVRMTAWTSCFRREAGGYGAHERGLIRIHQFEKIELYTICEPSDSDAELERMIACAEDILKALGLHYRVSLLAAQDCSFASAKTFDIEVWLPGQGAYYEVSSCSNCTDFQARRGLIRYREKEGEKSQLVHTLNASSLALPRLVVALMETYQQEDGSIALPDILTKLMR